MRSLLLRFPTVNPVFSLRTLVPRNLVSWTGSGLGYTAYRLCAQFPAGAALSPVRTARTPESSADMMSMEVPTLVLPASLTYLVEHHLPNTLRLATFEITLFATADAMWPSAQRVRIMFSKHLFLTFLSAFHT